MSQAEPFPDKIDWAKQSYLKELFAALDGDVRFVGGCVRDSLLGRAINDIDLATPLKPEDVIKKLEAENIRVIPTGLKHGTVTAYIAKKNIEITTLRKDVNCDGRHANVEFTDDWEEDAKRRDFTINAMSSDIDGVIYDYATGKEDLSYGLVRFVGNANERCVEDILRILRFFRFFSHYGKGEFGSDAISACAKNADQIKSLSGERIKSEMIKLLQAVNPLPVLQKMQKINVLEYIIAFEADFVKLEELIDKEQNWNVAIDPLVRLAAIADNVKKAEFENLCKKWKLSNKEQKRLGRLCLDRLDNFSSEKINKESIRSLGKELFKDKLVLSDVCDKENFLAITDFAEGWVIPKFPVGGEDLKKIGLETGPEIGRVLRKAEDWWAEKDYQPSKAEIISYIEAL